MKVKGTAFLARRALLEHSLGRERFGAWMQPWLAEHPEFPQPVIATTLVPWKVFVAFNDDVLATFYKGDARSYWLFGRSSAEWSLTQGPYKHLLDKHSVEDFAQSAPSLYRNYFTEGRATASAQPGRVELVLDGVESEFRHVYMEFAIMGYFERGLELVLGRTVRHQCIEGFSKRDARVCYVFSLR